MSRNPFSDEEIENAPDTALVYDTGVPAESAETNTEVVEETPPTPEDDVDTGESPEPVVGETEEERAERLFAGKYKSPDELEKGYENLHSLLGRKEAEYKAKLQEQEQLMEMLIEAAQEHDQQQGVGVPPDIEAFAMERPDAAMQWAVEQNRSAVPDVLAAIESVNPRLAREYEIAYTQMVTEERLSAHTEPLMAQMREQQQAMEVAQAFDKFRGSLGSDYDAIQEVLPQVIEKHAHLAETLPPDQFLEVVGSIARGLSVPKIEQAVVEREQAEAANRRMAAAETRSAPVADKGEPDEESLIKQAMFGTQSRYGTF